MSLSFNRKADMFDAIAWYKPTMNAIVTIHKDALVKYPLFSWELNVSPECSSTIYCCKNAILRHLILIGNGTYIDEESGYPHIAHVACRSHMLLTQVYRELHKDETPNSNNNGVGDSHFDPTSMLYKDVMLTPEFMLHLSKYAGNDNDSNTNISNIDNVYRSNPYYRTNPRQLKVSARYLISEILAMNDERYQACEFSYMTTILDVDKFMHNVSCVIKNMHEQTEFSCTKIPPKEEDTISNSSNSIVDKSTTLRCPIVDPKPFI
jgi:hypothetical protein